eukprot:PhF_6_TR30560/c0_g1_i1/m.44891
MNPLWNVLKHHDRYNVLGLSGQQQKLPTQPPLAYVDTIISQAGGVLSDTLRFMELNRLRGLVDTHGTISSLVQRAQNIILEIMEMDKDTKCMYCLDANDVSKLDRFRKKFGKGAGVFIKDLWNFVNRGGVKHDLVGLGSLILRMVEQTTVFYDPQSVAYAAAIRVERKLLYGNGAWLSSQEVQRVVEMCSVDASSATVLRWRTPTTIELVQQPKQQHQQQHSLTQYVSDLLPLWLAHRSQIGSLAKFKHPPRPLEVFSSSNSHSSVQLGMEEETSQGDDNKNTTTTAAGEIQNVSSLMGVCLVQMDENDKRRAAKRVRQAKLIQRFMNQQQQQQMTSTTPTILPFPKLVKSIYMEGKLPLDQHTCFKTTMDYKHSVDAFVRGVFRVRDDEDEEEELPPSLRRCLETKMR